MESGQVFNNKTSFYQAAYGNTTLHTNYNYFRANKFLKNSNEVLAELSRTQGAIARLETQEQQFYQKFGKKNYQEFITFLRELMSDGSQDGMLLKKASNQNVRDLIRQIMANKTGDQDVGNIELIVQVNTDKAQIDLGKIFEKLKGQEGISVIGEATLSITGNTPTMKKLVNKLASTHFVTESFNNKKLSKFLQTNEDFGELVTFSTNGRELTKTEVSDVIKPRPFPWGYTMKELQEMIHLEPSIWIPKFNYVLKEIRNRLEQYFLGGSQNFQQALKLSLDKVFSNGYQVFLVGQNIEAGLLGAFGEFGTVLLINYLQQIAPNANPDKRTAELVGFSNGKQDVLYQGFGIQVKNYSIQETGESFLTRRGIEVHQQPADIAEYFSDGQSFLGFMANFFFNKGIQEHASFVSLEELCEYLSKNLQGELLRLATADISDTVSFYNIGQQFFIPGSALLKMYIEAGRALRVTITSSGPIWNEEDGLSRGPNEYWRLDNGVWFPTEKNLSAFNGSINKHISITASMGSFRLNDFAYWT